MVRQADKKVPQSKRNHPQPEGLYYQSQSSQYNLPEKKNRPYKRKALKEKLPRGRPRKTMPIIQVEISSQPTVKRGRPKSLWTPQLHKRYLMALVNQIIQEPRRSIDWSRWKQKYIFNNLAMCVGSGITSDQVKSHNQIKQNQWIEKANGRGMLVMAVDQLFEQFVKKEFHQDALDLLTQLEEIISSQSDFFKFAQDSIGERHKQFMGKNAQIQKEFSVIENDCSSIFKYTT